MNHIEQVDGFCHIILDNKPQNYLTTPEFISPSELNSVVLQNKLKAILISGAGRHFSAGADMDTIFTMHKEGNLNTELNKGKDLLKLLKSFNLPIIACIEGACFGGGLEIALNSDIRIASKKSLFAFPEVNADLMPGFGGTVVTTNEIGKAKTLHLMLTGEVIDAEKALQLNLVDNLFDSKTVFDNGVRMAKKLTHERNLNVIKAIVESIRNAETLPYDEALKRETELFCSLVESVNNL